MDKQQIEPRLKEFQDSAQAVCRHMNRLRLEIMDQIAAMAPDLEAILSRQEQVEAAQRTMQALFVEQILAEKAILSREQQDRLFTSLRQRHACDRREPMTMSGRRTARSVAPFASNDHCRD